MYSLLDHESLFSQRRVNWFAFGTPELAANQTYLYLPTSDHAITEEDCIFHRGRFGELDVAVQHASHLVVADGDLLDRSTILEVVPEFLLSGVLLEVVDEDGSQIDGDELVLLILT